MTKNKFQGGFTAIEILLVVLIILLISIIGFFVYNNNKSEETTKTTDTTKTTVPTPKVATTQEDQVAFVQSFYNDYIADSSADAASVQKYGTDNFIAAVANSKDSDPVLCSQQGKTQATATVVKSGDEILSKVTYPSNSNSEVKVTVVNVNGKLAIDSTTCQ